MQAERQGWQTRHSLITGVGVTAGAVLGLSSSALAADITVTSTADPGDGDCATNGCTLREAVTAANATTSYDRILFQSGLSGTITLGGTPIPITEDVYIFGNGPDEITVSGNDASRIFDVNPTTSGERVGITRLTLANGSVTGDGGAIHNEDAALLVLHSVLSGNTASGKGGAIYHHGADLDGGSHNYLVYSTVSGNTAATGGGVYGNESVGTIGTSTLSGNAAIGGPGGGVSAGDDSRVYNSTIAGNTATTSGGGLQSNYGIDLHGSIVADNTAAVSDPDVDTPSLVATLSLIESPGATAVGPGNIVGQDPQLGPLAANGGWTETRKPAATSPVVDKGFSSPTPDFDQRLFSRPVDNPNATNAPSGDGADIGAVELTLAEGPQAPPAPTPAPAAPAPAPASAPTFNLQAAIKKCKKKFPKGPKRANCIKKARAKAQA